MNKKPARLVINDGRQFDLPVIEGSMGPPVVDVGQLAKHGLFTYDPGFLSTAACESKITYIDGQEGVLTHGGYGIADLARHSSFLEVCYLLLHGELPDQNQHDDFIRTITLHTMVHEQLTNFYDGFPRNAHPMAIMCGVVGALSAFYHDSTDINNERHREIAAHRLIAKMPTLAAMCYKYSIGQPFLYPDNKLNYSENFLRMMFGTPCEENDVSPVLTRAMEKIFILHADHEQNASTSTVRLAGSTGANPFACIASGIAALWGPSHGGANEAVLQMLNEIGDPKNIDKAIRRAKDKDDPFRLMGFGHRVYKSYDPRAEVMRETCHEVLEALDLTDDPLFQMAMRLEKIALEDEYFIAKSLYPNVDFYSGIVLKAMGVPLSMFTVIFATGRTPGWIAHWHEMISGDYRLSRPRQLYTGPEPRAYVPIDQR